MALAVTIYQGADAVTTRIFPTDAAANDEFGSSVAVSGNTAIVGAIRDDDNGTDSGSAYLFDITTGEQLAKLLPADGAAGDRFGHSVGISGNAAIVGAILDNDQGEQSGSAYLFDVATGAELAKLTPSDGAANDFFGSAVAVSGNTAIVGTPFGRDNGEQSGSAYLFDVTTGAELAKLTPRDGAAGDAFGWSVSISGDTAIVGAPFDGDNGEVSGSAYLFDVTTGTELVKLTPTDGAGSQLFGKSVAISGNLAIVGAPDQYGSSSSGSAYLFDVANGTQLAKLTPADGAAGQQFGISGAISGNTAIVGAFHDFGGHYHSGSAYVFNVATGRQLAKLAPTDVVPFHDGFGLSVGISDNTAIVADPYGYFSGAAYLFDVTTIVPEPATLVLIGLSLFCLVARRPTKEVHVPLGRVGMTSRLLSMGALGVVLAAGHASGAYFLPLGDIPGARFDSSNLTRASFVFTNLTNVNFTGANLNGADLGFAVLKDCDPEGAIVAEALSHRAVSL
jgi:hypothetical protein